jgi:hypothetical protein
MKLKDFMPGEGGRARTTSTIVYVLMSSATLLSLVFYQQNFQFPMCSYVSGKSAFRKKKGKSAMEQVRSTHPHFFDLFFFISLELYNFLIRFFFNSLKNKKQNGGK